MVKVMFLRNKCQPITHSKYNSDKLWTIFLNGGAKRLLLKEIMKLALNNFSLKYYIKRRKQVIKSSNVVTSAVFF